jgi:hypothetical protein
VCVDVILLMVHWLFKGRFVANYVLFNQNRTRVDPMMGVLASKRIIGVWWINICETLS